MTTETLFDELRAAREARAMTLDDVARETLINIRFLRALDAGDTSIMPQTYVRAFLRAYASCVGMDPTYAMQRLDGMPPRTAAPSGQQPAAPGHGQAESSVEIAVPSPQPVAPAPPPPPVQTPAPVATPAPAQETNVSEKPAPVREPSPGKVSPSKRSQAPRTKADTAPGAAPQEAPVASQEPPAAPPPVELQIPSPEEPTPGITAGAEEGPPFWSRSWVRSAGTTLVVVLGIATIAYFARQPGTPPQEIPFGTVLQENTTRLNPADTTKGTVMPQAVSPRDSLVLRASTTDSVWVQIARDALPPTEHLFPPGASRAWKARDRFTLSLGNAGGVSFRLNNRELGKLGKAGAVLRNVELTRENLTSPVKTEVQP